MGKPRVAFYQIMLANRKIRGPHLFFPDLFRHYQQFETAAFDLYYFIKTDDQQGILEEFKKRNIPTERLVLLSTQNNRLKNWLEWRELKKKLKSLKIDLFQTLVLDSPEEQIPQLKKIPKRVKQAFTVTYNGIPTAFENDYDIRFAKDRKKYGQLFSEVNLDGILSWYDHIESFVESHSFFPKKPLVYSIKSRFCDSSRFFPEKKEKWIVFASALVPYKHPILFMEAVLNVLSDNPKLLEGWKIKVIGNGSEEQLVRQIIEEKGLQDLFELTAGLSDISPVLKKSMIYISTQEIENFPSLAMNEAMAAGNMIIARNVGRTNLFVEQGKNGLLAKQDSANGIAACLTQLLSNPERWKAMMDHSVWLTQNTHTPANFITQLEEFWNQVLK